MQIDFSKAIYDQQGQPLDYPGRMISRPLLIAGGAYQELQHSNDFSQFWLEDGRNLDGVLHQRHQAGIHERIVQVAFGANRNLENIAWKFRNYHEADHSISQDFIALPGVIRNVDVVACNVGYWGYIYSGLLATTEALNLRHYLFGTVCPVVVLLLDQSQLNAVHRSEGVPRTDRGPDGVSCDISDIEVELSASIVCEAQVYSLSVPFLSFDGVLPVAFDQVETKGRANYPVLSQKAMFTKINDCLRLEEPLPGRVPIAESLHRLALNLLSDGTHALRQLTHDPFYARVRHEIAEQLVLRDSDGRVRKGLEDIYPPREVKDAWTPKPLFEPRDKRVIVTAKSNRMDRFRDG